MWGLVSVTRRGPYLGGCGGGDGELQYQTGDGVLRSVPRCSVRVGDVCVTASAVRREATHRSRALNRDSSAAT